MIKNNSLPSITASDASLQLECHAEYLEYYAWTQVFGSTSGPFGGIGGQAITTFTIEAWYAGGGMALLFCNGRLIKLTTEFTPLMRV